MRQCCGEEAALRHRPGAESILTPPFEHILSGRPVYRHTSVVELQCGSHAEQSELDFALRPTWIEARGRLQLSGSYSLWAVDEAHHGAERGRRRVHSPTPLNNQPPPVPAWHPGAWQYLPSILITASMPTQQCLSHAYNLLSAKCEKRWARDGPPH